MKRTLMQHQVLMVTIVSPKDVVMGHGSCTDIPGKEWYRGEFTTQADADAKFAEVNRRFQVEEVERGSWMSRPKMTIDWVTVSTQTITEP